MIFNEGSPKVHSLWPRSMTHEPGFRSSVRGFGQRNREHQMVRDPRTSVISVSSVPQWKIEADLPLGFGFRDEPSATAASLVYPPEPDGIIRKSVPGLVPGFSRLMPLPGPAPGLTAPPHPPETRKPGRVPPMRDAGPARHAESAAVEICWHFEWNVLEERPALARQNRSGKNIAFRRCRFRRPV
jgi:hypothetical protein